MEDNIDLDVVKVYFPMPSWEGRSYIVLDGDSGPVRIDCPSEGIDLLIDDTLSLVVTRAREFKEAFEVKGSEEWLEEEREKKQSSLRSWKS